MTTKLQHGGARHGAGKPKGTKHSNTIEKHAVLRETQQRVYRNIDGLLNAQLANALGSVMIFRKDSVEGSNGKEKTVHTLITDPDEIKEVLDGSGGKGGQLEGGFYIVTAVPPDNRAIDSLLDRGLGKATQSIEVTTDNTFFERDVYRTALVIIVRNWTDDPDYIERAITAMVNEYGYDTEEFQSRVSQAIDEYREMKHKNDSFRELQLEDK
jgi:hypothetical protein